MRIPVLTYHSMAIGGNDYGNNDHVAFAADLEQITARGYAIVPLHEAIDHWARGTRAWDGRKVVALTCDDGPDFDFHDLPHPSAGAQRSMINILRDFRARHRREQPGLHLTSFVIASPSAREALDRSCMIGRGWWNDDWWPLAVASGLMGIGNHSWDHNHDALPYPALDGIDRGTFQTIAEPRQAQYQIDQAATYLRQQAPNPATALFAYPYGKVVDFLLREYLPRNAGRLGLRAALADDAVPLTRGCNPWQIPRFVFGRDWKSPDELRRVLAA